MTFTRRSLVLGGLVSMGWSRVVLAQNTKALPHIAVLFGRDSKYMAQFLQGMRELGYLEGQHFLLELPVWALMDRSDTPFDPVLRELVNRKPDVIVAGGTPFLVAAKRYTATIPIIMATVGDPVAQGFVKSLAHPGGHMTGFSLIEDEVAPKRLELLRELLPKAKRFAVLHNPSLASLESLVWKALDPAAGKLGVQLTRFAASKLSDLDAALTAIAKGRAQGVLVFNTQPFSVGTGQKKLSEFFLRSRIPAMHGDREFVVGGGLMSYGVNIADNYRQSARLVDRILKGAKPGDLPIEQPTKYELVINLKAAKAIGFTFPQSFIARADEVIE